MFVRTPSTVRLIGAGLTSIGAVAALLLAPSASKAQQLEITGDRAAYLAAQCDHIKDHAKATGCYAEKSLEFSRARIEAAKQRLGTAKQGIASEAELQRCTAFLRGKRDTGTVFDRKITRENVCPYARELGMQGGPG